MKYTPQQYETAKKFREFYYGEINLKNALEEGWWESMSEDTWNRWKDLYVTGKGFQPKEEPAGDRARKLTKEFFAAKKETVVKPSSYTFVSTDKDVDLIRVVEEAPEGANFILVESRDRNNNVLKKSWVLVSRSALQNPRLQNGTLHNQAVSPSWGITFTKGWRISFVTQNYVQAVRENIEALLRVLNPKNTKTTVTVW